MPQWQPIETVWTNMKNHIQREYHHAKQNYPKMRQDVVHGFYGKPGTSYKGITPSMTNRLIKKCEKSMLTWLNQYTEHNVSSLIDFKFQANDSNLDMIEDF